MDSPPSDPFGSGAGDPEPRGFHSARHDDRLLDIRVLLHHLERFRWCFIKSAIAVLLGMVLCLAAGNWIVEVLKWPLVRASARQAVPASVVYLATSTNNLTRLPVPEHPAWSSLLGGRGSVLLQLHPVAYRTNTVLGLLATSGPGRTAQMATVELNVYGPVGGFVVAIQVALFGGLLLALPFVFYFLAHFSLPLLGAGGEMVKRAVGPWVAVALGLFLAGVAFCYFLLLPVSLYGSVGFAQWMNFDANEWRAEAYIGFVCKFMLAMGVGFELPLVILFLTNIGLLNHAKLKAFRPYWVVLDLVVSALLTPDGSPMTMLLMAAPLLVLYEISVWIVHRMEKRASEESGG